MQTSSAASLDSGADTFAGASGASSLTRSAHARAIRRQGCLRLSCVKAESDGRTHDLFASFTDLTLIFVPAVGSIVYACQSTLDEHLKR